MQKRAVSGFTLWSYSANLVILLFVRMKKAACVSIYMYLFGVHVAFSLPLQCVHLNTVCCLKETELIANDI